MKKELFVSVCCLLDDYFKSTFEEVLNIRAVLESEYTDYEVLLLDNSIDSRYLGTIDQFLKSTTCIRYLRPAHILEHDVATAVLLDNAIGDVIVHFDINTEPLDVIIPGVNAIAGGQNIVIGQAHRPASLGYKLIRPMAGFILKEVGLNLPKNATYLWFFSRQALNVITDSAKFYHAFQSRIVFSGMDINPFPYQPKVVRKKHFYGSVQLVLRQIIFSSTRPLRWMSLLGLSGSVLAFFFSVYSILIKIFKSTAVEGWMTIVLFNSILFSILFLILAFFGEYIGRILNDRSESKDYVFSVEKSCPSMLDPFRVNVQNGK